MPTMPESVCLHVQARDVDAVRVVDLRGGLIRIGRAAYCDVRLNDPEVPDEACRLRRQGTTWLLVPSRASQAAGGSVLLEFAPVEEPRVLPLGVPFRIGSFRLTLQAADAAPASWTVHETPRIDPVEPSGPKLDPRERPWGTDVAPAPAEQRPLPLEPVPTAELRNGWRTRVETPTKDRWVRSRKETERWEGRFRAVGARLEAVPEEPPPAPVAASSAWLDARARSVVDPAMPGSRPFGVASTPPPPRAPRPATVARPRTDRGAAVPLAAEPARPKSVRATPLERRVEPLRRPREVPTPPVVMPSRPERPGIATREAGPPAPSPSPPSTVAAVDPPPIPESASASLLVPSMVPLETNEAGAAEVVATLELFEGWVPEAASSVESRPEPEVVVVEAEAAPAAQATPAPIEPPAAFEEDDDEDRYLDEAVPAGRMLGAARRVSSESVLEEPRTEEPRAVEPEVAPPRLETPATEPPVEAAPHEGWVYPDRFVADTTLGTSSHWVDDAPGVQATEWTARGGGRDEPGAHHGAASQARLGGATVFATTHGDGIGPSPRSGGRDLPSVADIYAARGGDRRPAGARGRDAAPAPAPARRGSPPPEPTVSSAPGEWSVPLWLGWLPTTVVCLGVGAVGCLASWTWARDAYNAGVVAARLGQAEPGKKPLPEGVSPGRTSWWASTSTHLLEWAVYLDRTASDPAQATEARALLDRAAEASPIHPGVRFTLAHPLPGETGTPSLARALGQSRDVAALAWSGRRLLASGKKAEALRAYRSALEMAATGDLASAATPAFLEDSETRRYALPAEDQVGAVVRDMADQTAWTYADWASAVPKRTVAPVVVARVLRERGSNDAETALDLALAEAAEPPTGTGPEGAVLLAAQGEALALRGRWNEARERYRLAIDAMPRDVIRRSWWMNLADIALRLNEESTRLKALDLAKSGDTKDEITTRAVELQKAAGMDGQRPIVRTARAADPIP